MLSTNLGSLEEISHREREFPGIGSVILRTSRYLAKCQSHEIDKIIQQSIADVSAIEGAEQAGWFLLSDSGELTDVFPSSTSHLPLSPVLRNSLQRLPWCWAQLKADNAFVIHDSNDFFPASDADREFLRAAHVRSLAFLPSSSVGLGRTVLVLASNSTETGWSYSLLEEGTLLEEIFSSAYQRREPLKESLFEISGFQQLFSDSVAAMAILDSMGQIIWTNHTLRELLGYSEGELRTMKCVDIAIPLDPNDKAPHLKYSPDLIKANHRCERTLIRKDKSLIPVVVQTDIVERQFPEDYLLLVNIENLTEQKAMATELSRKHIEVSALASLLIQSQENERKRLSRELHDDIGQRLSLAASEAALMADQQSSAESLSSDRLEHLRDELDALCTDIHGMSHELHSYKLQHLGLKAALKDLCRRLSQPNFRVDLHADEFEEATSTDVSLCLYRIAQEALNNALRHAHTPVAAVTITKLQNMFYMMIQDTGIGFNSSISSNGLGLVSMRERLRLVNGQFRLHSVPGRGTEIWVSVPDKFESIPPNLNCQESTPTAATVA